MIKKLKCDRCNKKVNATNKLNDDRFYCSECGKNLGCYNLKRSSK
jgi:hypothetical protein